MAGPSPLLDALPESGVRRRLRAARLVLRVEAVWPVLVALASWAALFVALALFDLLPRLPGWLHATVLVLFAAPLALVPRALRATWRVDWRTAARRLENDAGLTHRPFQTLWDNPVGGDAALWDRHRRAAAALVAAAPWPWPRSDMAARDPWGLRAAALLVLVVALAGAGGDWRARLTRAVDPPVVLPGLGPDSLEVWITPPAYTGLPPRLLHPKDAAGLVSVPVGSTVLAVLTGGWGTARLAVDGHETAFAPQSGGGQRVESQLQGGHRLTVRQFGRDVASWPLSVVADLSPDVEFAAPPEAAERGRLLMAVVASDDHGLARLWVEIRRLGAPLHEPPVQVPLPVPTDHPKQFGASSWHDLTSHPWAGLAVVVQPMAEDALGQRGAGETATLTLPERSFLNPNARMVIEQRRLLSESRRNASGAMGILDQMSVDPARYNDDGLTFLALRVARHALGRDGFDLDEVQDLLWNAALRIEDGDLAAAEQRLEEARRALEQGLDARLDQAAVQDLLDQFQAALRRYLDALAERVGAETLSGTLSEDGSALSERDLLDMVAAMRDMAAVGARDGMKQMLRDMANLLDGLQTRLPQAPSDNAAQILRGLRDMVGRQQRLLEQSHRQMHQGGDTAPQAAARNQEQLRRDLDGLRDRLRQELGQEPAALDDSAAAMAQAVEALKQGAWASAADAQAQALDFLNQGTGQAMEDMAAGALLGPGGIPRDMLGRPQHGGRGSGDDGATKVPDQAERQRARAILDELRRRAGEATRPAAERDYLHRLLKQF